MIIPQGTALFRGFNNTSTLTSDFAGMDDGGKFCLHENYNVFFYPFPFVSGSVSNYTYTTLYVTMRDLKLINLILPSKYNRRDKESGIGGIVRCDKAPMGCGKKGRHFDPCVDYSKVPKDVSGVVAIAQADAHNLKMSKVIFENWINKYFATYKDSRGLVGVPEIILHPRMDKTPQTETISDFKPWYRKNKRKFNYNYLRIMSSEPGSVKQMMDAFMSDGGLDFGDIEPYHMKLNKKTGFFQIEEFSHNLSELISPNIAVSPEADLVLTRANIYDGDENIFNKFPKADTIPKELNIYFTKQGSVSLTPSLLMWLATFSDRYTSHEIVSIPLRKNVELEVFHLNNKRYVFLPNPVGREIEKQATINNDKSFFTSDGFLENHPINSQISAYELGGKNVPSDTPARQVNGMLQHYLEHKGSKTLINGASRRRTRRIKTH